MIRRRALLAAAAALGVAPQKVLAQVLNSDAQNALLQEARYWPLYRYLTSTSDEAALSFRAEFLAALGDEKRALARSAPLPDPATLQQALDSWTQALSGARAEDALDVIAARARNHRIVILNEAHNAQRCRAFGTAVLHRLRPLGFNWFAAEALASAGEDLAAMRPGAPVTMDLGFYFMDPMFAGMARAARDLDCRFARYEFIPPGMADEAARMAARDEGQAVNLVANVFDKDPNARLFVYCGFDHALETPTAAGQSWMAARLKQKTGLDPLTITQSGGVPPPDQADELPTMAMALDKFKPTAPIVAWRADGTPLIRQTTPPGGYDLSVFHPRIARADGRSGWLPQIPGVRRTSFRFPTPIGREGLVQAVPAQELRLSTKAIPSDQQLVMQDAREVVFYLPPGAHEVRIEDDSGRRAIGSVGA